MKHALWDLFRDNKYTKFGIVVLVPRKLLLEPEVSMKDRNQTFEDKEV